MEPNTATETGDKRVTYESPGPEGQSKKGTWKGRAACGQIYFGGNYLGNIISPTHMPQFSEEGEEWILSATGERPDFGRFHTVEHASCLSMNASHKAQLKADIDGHAELPPLWVIQVYFESFSKSGIKHVFPIVEEVLFHEAIQRAYGPEPVPPQGPAQYITARAFVWAFAALMKFQFPSIPASSYVDGWACVARAQILVNECLEHVSLTLAQTLVILVSHGTTTV